METLRPLQERYREFAQDPGSVQAILADGASRAGDMAAKTLERARSAIGLGLPGQARRKRVLLAGTPAGEIGAGHTASRHLAAIACPLKGQRSDLRKARRVSRGMHTARGSTSGTA